MNLTEGQSAVILFDVWIDMLIKGEVPDCKRYHNEFLEFYNGIVKSDKSPFYLMFCAFVGAFDMNNACRQEGDHNNEKEK